MFASFLELIFVIVFRSTGGVVLSKAYAFFDQLSSTRLFGFPATGLGDPIVTRLSIKVRPFSSLT